MISIDGNKLSTMKSDLNKLFTKEEIMQGKDTLKNRKSTGIDGVRNEIIKQCLNNSSFVDTLVTLLNQVFEMGNYPNIWKTDLVKPIHKKGSTNKESN